MCGFGTDGRIAVHLSAYLQLEQASAVCWPVLGSQFSRISDFAELALQKTLGGAADMAS